MLHPFCLYVHLPADLENAACLMSRGLRDQNLTARRARLDARSQVYLTSYDVVLHPLGRADVSYNHLPGMYADAHLDLRQVLESILLINGIHCQLHGDCAGNRSDNEVKPRRSAITIVTLRFSPPICNPPGDSSTASTTSSVRYRPNVSRMNRFRNSTCSARRCNSASIRLRSEISAQDPTISFGLPSWSRVTVKVSWIQMQCPSRWRNRYSIAPPSWPIRRSSSANTRAESSG